MTISGDFFHVEEEGIISSPIPATEILLDGNAMGAASPYNQFLHFGSPTGPNLTSNAAGQIQGSAGNYFVTTSLANDLQFRESTVDINVNYDHDFGPQFGGITLGVQGTYYLQAKGNEAAGGPDFDFIGIYLGDTFGDSNYTPSYRLSPYASYRYGGATTSAPSGTHIPSTRDGDYIDPAGPVGELHHDG